MPDDTGLLQIWKDGKLAVERRGINVYSTIEVAYTPYLKTGIYRPDWHRKDDQSKSAFEMEKSSETNKIILVTGVKVGSERARYEDVVPMP